LKKYYFISDVKTANRITLTVEKVCLLEFFNPIFFIDFFFILS
jgi:hypothetical protein